MLNEFHTLTWGTLCFLLVQPVMTASLDTTDCYVSYCSRVRARSKVVEHCISLQLFTVWYVFIMLYKIQ